MDGVEEYWSGEVDGYTITTTMIKDDPIHKSVKLFLEPKKGQSYNDSIKRVGAHEFGHAAFQFNDNVYDERHTYVSKPIGNINSIMYIPDYYDPADKSLDLAMLLEKCKVGFSDRTYYADYPEILDEYASGWKKKY